MPTGRPPTARMPTRLSLFQRASRSSTPSMLRAGPKNGPRASLHFPLDQIGQGPPVHDPLWWKIFDHMCEKYSKIRDQAITDRPQTRARPCPKPATGQQPPGTSAKRRR
jgi:hypothetical protein